MNPPHEPGGARATSGRAATWCVRGAVGLAAALVFFRWLGVWPEPPAPAAGAPVPRRVDAAASRTGAASRGAHKGEEPVSPRADPPKARPQPAAGAPELAPRRWSPAPSGVLIVSGTVSNPDGSAARAAVEGSLYTRNQESHIRVQGGMSDDAGNWRLTWHVDAKTAERLPFKLILRSWNPNGNARLEVDLPKLGEHEVQVQLQAVPDRVQISGRVVRDGQPLPGVDVKVDLTYRDGVSWVGYEVKTNGLGQFTVPTRERYLAMSGPVIVEVLSGTQRLAKETLPVADLRNGTATIDVTGKYTQVTVIIKDHLPLKEHERRGREYLVDPVDASTGKPVGLLQTRTTRTVVGLRPGHYEIIVHHLSPRVARKRVTVERDPIEVEIELK